MNIIDAHIHLNLKEGSPVSGLLHQMDKHGIGKAMLILNIKEEYDAFINDINSYKSNQDRFWMACGINIHDESSFSRFDDLSQMGLEPKIKIHPKLFKIKKEDIDRVVDSIAQYDTQIIIDTLYSGHEIEYHNGIETGIAIALRYPERKVVLAHSGSVEFLKCMMATRYLPNVCYDYSFIQTYFQHTSLRIDMVDFLRRTANRIMFGSDYPSFQLDNALNNMKSLANEAGLTEKQTEMVMGLNAEQIYGHAKRI